MGRGRFDFAAFTAACVAVAMLAAYVAIMRGQGDQPLVWFSAALVAGTALATYGVYRPAPHRRTVLLVAAVVLCLSGLIALLTIGAPIVFAGVLCLLAALLERPATADR